MISNSKSFTCLLKEIDEEDEKHIAGSLPAAGKVGRPEPANLDHITEQEDDHAPGVYIYA